MSNCFERGCNGCENCIEPETQAPDPAPLTIYISRMDAETLRSRGRCTLIAYTERVGNESNEVALTTIPAPEGAQALPPPDTHCWDDDTGRDVWSYSADLVRSIVSAALAAPAPQAPVALPDVDLCRVMAAHEVYQYHPGALHEFAHEVIAEFCRLNGITAPQTKEPTNDR